jgi:hypothetical protein
MHQTCSLLHWQRSPQRAIRCNTSASADLSTHFPLRCAPSDSHPSRFQSEEDAALKKELEGWVTEAQVRGQSLKFAFLADFGCFLLFKFFQFSIPYCFLWRVSMAEAVH